MKPLSLGKIRCFQQLSNEAGIFTVTAFDHRDVLVDTLSQTLAVEEAAWETVAAVKIEIAKALAPHASAVLLDPEYSAGPVIASGVLPRHVAFAVGREKSGYSGESAGRVTTLLADWSVAAIKQMGGAAVKLLLFYHPDAPTAADQEAIVCQIAEECRTYDIPLMLEPICYPLEPNLEKNSAEFAAKRPDIVLRSAQRLIPLGVDLLKAEFPTDANFETDTRLMAGYCRQLSAISAGIPWVILSAGVDFTTFLQQVEIACQNGASGFVAGRAIWREALETADEVVRDQFLTRTAVERTQQLTEAANTYATPWSKRVETRLPRYQAGWYIQYNTEVNSV